MISETFRDVLALHLKKQGAREEDKNKGNWPRAYSRAVFNALHESPALFCPEVAAKALGVTKQRIINLRTVCAGQQIELIKNITKKW